MLQYFDAALILLRTEPHKRQAVPEDIPETMHILEYSESQFGYVCA